MRKLTEKEAATMKVAIMKFMPLNSERQWEDLNGMDVRLFKDERGTIKVCYDFNKNEKVKNTTAFYTSDQTLDFYAVTMANNQQAFVRINMVGSKFGDIYDYEPKNKLHVTERFHHENRYHSIVTDERLRLAEESEYALIQISARRYTVARRRMRWTSGGGSEGARHIGFVEHSTLGSKPLNYRDARQEYRRLHEAEINMLRERDWGWE